jgi:hypothetical protein
LRESLKQEDRKYEAEGDNSMTQELHITFADTLLLRRAHLSDITPSRIRDKEDPNINARAALRR